MIALLVWLVSYCVFSLADVATREINVEFCEKQAKDPYFDVDLVVGKTWRTYYTWNMNFGDRCYESTFTKPTKETIERIRAEMQDYLVEQPRWAGAALVAGTRVGDTRHELLLFPDRGPAGRFLALPNVARTPDNFPLSKGVKLLKLFMKLVSNGKYLLVMDCVVRGASLATAAQPYRADVDTRAAALAVEGTSYPACTMEKHKNELTYEEKK